MTENEQEVPRVGFLDTTPGLSCLELYVILNGNHHAWAAASDDILAQTKASQPDAAVQA